MAGPKLKEAELSDEPEEQTSADQSRKSILDLLSSEPQLRSKRELIEKFIENYLPRLQSAKEVEPEFEKFWEEERKQSIQALCRAEGLRPETVAKIIDEYHFTQREPLRETIVSALKEKPKILQRNRIIERVRQSLMTIIETFDDW